MVGRIRSAAPRLVALLALPLALGCGSGPDGSASEAVSIDFTGHFKVEGSTVTRRSEVSRPIRGTVIIAHRQPSAPHVVTFALKTRFSTPEGPIEAEIIGNARAQRAEGVLRGRAETQILMGTVPGIDPTFPFIPARLGPQIVSGFHMVPDPDAEGGFRIEIESEAADERQGYESTRTTLRASRAPGPLARPDAAAPEGG